MRQGKALIAAALIAAATVSIAAAPPADARVRVGIGIGLPLFAPIYPAPVYAYPAPAYAYPAPAYYVPPPAPAPVAAAPQGQCRPYSATETIDGTPQQVTGTACLQPDGSWRIVG